MARSGAPQWVLVGYGRHVQTTVDHAIRQLDATVRLDAATLGHGTGEPVLSEVTVTARPGRILAVTGPSGAGKTTLLSAMAGVLRPASGSVLLGGEPLRDRDHAVARKVVLVPQDNGLAAVLTAGENLQVSLIASGLTPVEARRAAAAALDRLGLAGQSNQLVEELSGGQQQRTALARAFALRGDVLLADEVTSELDAANRQLVLDLLRAEADRGATVVFATHDPEAAAACDAELHLLDGQAELTRDWADPDRDKRVGPDREPRADPDQENSAL